MDMSQKMLSPRAVILSEDDSATAKALIAQKLYEAAPEAGEVQLTWKAKRRDDMCDDGTTSDFEADCVLNQALENELLSAGFKISVKVPGVKGVSVVSISEVLADVDHFDGLTTLDPIEPEYDGGRTTGKLYLKGDKPVLVSLAHGKTTYRLQSTFQESQVDQQDVEYTPKEHSSFIDRCVDLMQKTGQYYSSGTMIILMSKGKAIALNRERLGYELSKLVAAYTVKNTRNGPTTTNIGLSDSIVKQIIEVGPDRLPRLNGVSDHPLVLPNGTLLDETGYDKDTGLFILNGKSRFPPIYQNPTDAQLLHAVNVCMSPFSEYHYVNQSSGKTAILTAVLLAVLRPALATAPLIATSSKKTGVGKGYLNQAISIIATGELPQFRNVERSNASELRKVLFTELLERKSIIAFDNMDGLINNETLSSFLTSPVWSDRILGMSKSGGLLRNDILTTLNGVNLSVGKNLARKVLLIELQESGLDHRFRRFDFLPHQKATENRAAIIAAALTIACHAAASTTDNKTIGSFEEATALIRVPLADIANRLPSTGLVDPIVLFEELVEQDVDSPVEIELLELIHAETKGEAFTANDLRNLSFQNGTVERAMKEFCASSPSMTTHSVAAVLTQLRGELLGDLTLLSRKTRGTNTWYIESVKTDGHA